MFRQIFAAAIAAGIASGVAVSLIHEVTTTPIIHQAEEYEAASGDVTVHVARPMPRSGDSREWVWRVAESHDRGDHDAWAPEDGLERSLFTAGTNIVLGVGFALLLCACYAIRGQEVTPRQGVVWGLAGFAAFTLSPALGLPPEVPGVMAADLEDRQLWWIFAAVSAAVGLALMVFAGRVALIALGALLIALPHIVGAPQPDAFGGPVPPEIAGHFAAASIVTSAIFWAMLGWFSGYFFNRLAETEN